MADEPSFFGREAFGGRFWSLIAAIVLVVAVAAGAIVIVATRGSSASPNKAAAAGGCPLTSVVSDAIPTAAPADTTWVTVRDFKLAVTSAGPQNHTDGHWSCYAHSPLGGLEAVMGLSANLLVGDRAAVQAMFPAGSVSAAQLDSLVPTGGAGRQAGAKIIGFIYGAFSRQGGQVSLVDSCTVSSCPSPLYSTEYTVTWAGRWLVDPSRAATTTLSSTAGVTAWEAP